MRLIGHASDVDPDVRLLLLSQPGRHQRQGGMEAPSDRSVSGILERRRCKAAKSALEGSLSDAGTKLRSGLEDLKTIGKADPMQIIIAYNVECLPK